MSELRQGGQFSSHDSSLGLGDGSSSESDTSSDLSSISTTREDNQEETKHNYTSTTDEEENVEQEDKDGRDDVPEPLVVGTAVPSCDRLCLLPDIRSQFHIPTVSEEVRDSSK